MQKSTFMFVYGANDQVLGINQYAAERHQQYRRDETLKEFLNRLKTDGWELIRLNPESGRYVLMKTAQPQARTM